MLFTRIGAEADSGRVVPREGESEEPKAVFSLKRQTLRKFNQNASLSEPEVGYANNDSPSYRGSSMPLWSWYTVRKCGPKREIIIEG
jgi:hypothetical protein